MTSSSACDSSEHRSLSFNFSSFSSSSAAAAAADYSAAIDVQAARMFAAQMILRIIFCFRFLDYFRL